MTMRNMVALTASSRSRRVVSALAIFVSTLAMLPRAEAQTSLPEITVTVPPHQPPRIHDELERKHSGSGLNEPGAKQSGAGSFERLNQQLKRKVDETNPVVNAPPLDARSPDARIGVVNIPGVQQQYGRNFGNSVIPYRPGVVSPPPLGHR